MKAFWETVLIFFALWTLVMIYEWWCGNREGR